MAISDRITSIEEHLKESYQELEGIGIDTTGVNNNLENIPKLLDGYWETLPKVTDEGTSITLDNTKEGKMKVLLKGNTSQETTTGKNKMPYSSYNANDNRTLNIPNLELNAGTYTISFDLESKTLGTNTNFSIAMGLFFEDNTSTDIILIAIDSNTTLGKKNITFTTTKNVILNSRSNIRIGAVYYDNGARAKLNNIQIEAGSSASDYEEYTGGIASPNPDYPQEVHTVSGDNKIKVNSRNFYDRANATENKALAWSSGNNYNENQAITSDYIKVNTNEQYSINYWSAFFFYDKNKSYLGCLQTDGTTIEKSTGNTFKKFTIPNYNSIYYMRISTRSSSENNNKDMTKENIMLNKGTTLANYEPYQSTTYPINLPEGMFLGSIGEYEDRFFKAIEGDSVYDSLDSATKQTLDSNEWYLEKKIGKYRLPNTTGGYNTTSNWYYFGLPNLPINIMTTTMVCNYFYYMEYIASDYVAISYSSNRNNILIRVPNLASTEAYRTWLGDNEVYIYYVLKTPTYTKIEGTLASQLEALNGSKSYTPQTNISQNNNDMASVLNATALSDGTVTPSLQGVQTLSLGQNVDLQPQEPIEEQTEEVEEQGEEL